MQGDEIRRGARVAALALDHDGDVRDGLGHTQRWTVVIPGSSRERHTTAAATHNAAAQRAHALAADCAMQGRGVGRARLSTIRREHLLHHRHQRNKQAARRLPTHLGLAALVVVRLVGEADLGRLKPNLERVAVGVREVPASGG